MIIRSVLLAAGLALAPVAFADGGDSSADATAAGNFLPTVTASQGVVIRVPINDGQEDQANAELRVVTADSATSRPDGYAVAFDRATDVRGVPVVSQAGDTSTDSSTNYWGWGNWRNYNYYDNYYYNYRPSYYYGFDRYNFGYGGYYYGGYNGRSDYCYYYYPRYW